MLSLARPAQPGNSGLTNRSGIERLGCRLLRLGRSDGVGRGTCMNKSSELGVKAEEQAKRAEEMEDSAEMQDNCRDELFNQDPCTL